MDEQNAAKKQDEGAVMGGAVMGDMNSILGGLLGQPERPTVAKCGPEELKELCSRYNDRKEFKPGDLITEKAGLEVYGTFHHADFAVFVGYMDEVDLDDQMDPNDCWYGVKMEKRTSGRSSFVIFPADSKRFDHYRP